MAPSSLKLVYNRIAWLYDGLRPLWVGREAERALDALLNETLRGSSHVLDLGCGTGANLKRIMKQGGGFATYLGIDHSEHMLERAARTCHSGSRITWSVADLTQPLAFHRSFDLILCTWMLSHLSEPGQLVSRAEALLSPGGTAAFLFFSPPHSRLHEYLTSWFMRLVQCARIDPAQLKECPSLDRIERFCGGAASLVVLRKSTSKQV